MQNNNIEYLKKDYFKSNYFESKFGSSFKLVETKSTCSSISTKFTTKNNRKENVKTTYWMCY